MTKPIMKLLFEISGSVMALQWQSVEMPDQSLARSTDALSHLHHCPWLMALSFRCLSLHCLSPQCLPSECPGYFSLLSFARRPAVMLAMMPASVAILGPDEVGLLLPTLVMSLCLSGLPNPLLWSTFRCQ